MAIREAKVSTRVQRAFQQTFFGTIHSYCVRLLDRFGHYLGLPSPVGLLQDDTELWNRFCSADSVRERAQADELQNLFHFYAPEKLYALGRKFAGRADSCGAVPELDWKLLLDYRDNALHAATKKSIAKAQEAARIWGDAWSRGEHSGPCRNVLIGESGGLCRNLG